MQNLNRTSLSSLRAIEAIGRLGTLARAADELGVTPGAVSQRLAKGEAQLGVQLFHRTQAGLTPTDDCARILPRLTLGMEHMAAAVAQIVGAGQCSLMVSVAPIFASRWLIWRIRRFHELEPAISVRVEPRAEIVDLRRSEVDVGLRVGLDPGPGLTGVKLLEQRVFPVCSPEVASDIETVEDLLSAPIIRENDSLFGWETWLEGTGLSITADAPGPTYADASLCLDAALTGQGVFMAWETLACDLLETGRLVAPIPRRCATGQAYWFVPNPHSGDKLAVRKFRKWLEAELERSVNEWRVGATG